MLKPKVLKLKWIFTIFLALDSFVSAEIFAAEDDYVFLTAGQSNAGNSECNRCQPNQGASPQVSFLMDKGFKSFNALDLKNPPPYGELSFLNQTSRSPLAAGERQSVWSALGKRIVSYAGRSVKFIALGIGDTTIEQWADPEKFYHLFLYGKVIRPTAVLWHQGETDVIRGTTHDQYLNQLKKLIQNTRKDLGFEVPWFVSVATKCHKTDLKKSVAISEAQRKIQKVGLNQVFAGPDTDAIPHSCHFDTQAEFDKYAQSWFNALKKSGILERN